MTKFTLDLSASKAGIIDTAVYDLDTADAVLIAIRAHDEALFEAIMRALDAHDRSDAQIDTIVDMVGGAIAEGMLEFPGGRAILLDALERLELTPAELFDAKDFFGAAAQEAVRNQIAEAAEGQFTASIGGRVGADFQTAWDFLPTDDGASATREAVSGIIGSTASESGVIDWFKSTWDSVFGSHEKLQNMGEEKSQDTSQIPTTTLKRPDKSQLETVNDQIDKIHKVIDGNKSAKAGFDDAKAGTTRDADTLKDADLDFGSYQAGRRLHNDLEELQKKKTALEDAKADAESSQDPGAPDMDDNGTPSEPIVVVSGENQPIVTEMIRDIPDVELNPDETDTLILNEQDLIRGQANLPAIGLYDAGLIQPLDADDAEEKPFDPSQGGTDAGRYVEVVDINVDFAVVDSGDMLQVG